MSDGSNLPKVKCYASLYGNNGGDKQMMVRRKWCSGEYCSDSDHARPLAAAGTALKVSWLNYYPRPEVTDLSHQWTQLPGDPSLSPPTLFPLSYYLSSFFGVLLSLQKSTHPTRV